MLLSVVLTEVVGRQRSRVRVDVADGVLKLRIGFEGQQRAKDLIRHAQRVVVWIQNQRGWDFVGRVIREVLVRRVNRDRLNATLMGISQVTLHALVMALVHHRRVLLVGEQRGVHLGDHILGDRYGLIEFVLRQHHIIGRNAYLAGIEHLAHHDALHGFCQIGGVGDHDR